MSTPIDLTQVATAPFEPTGEHARLTLLAGRWTGTTKTWLDPSAPPEETRTEAIVESVLGGRFLRIQYRGTVIGKPHAGEMLLAFEKDEQHYSLAWIDSFHTGTALMLSTGGPASDSIISVLGSYAAGEARWSWRTVLRADTNAFVIEAFNIAPDGKEDPATRTSLERA